MNNFVLQVLQACQVSVVSILIRLVAGWLRIVVQFPLHAEHLSVPQSIQTGSGTTALYSTGTKALSLQ